MGEVESATIKPLISGCFGFVTGVGGGQWRGPFQLDLRAEKSQAGEGGEAEPLHRARCKVSLWPLRLTPHAHAYTHSRLSRASDLSPGGSRPWAGLDGSETTTPLRPDSARRHLTEPSSRWALRTVFFFFFQKSRVTWLGPSSYPGRHSREFGGATQPILSAMARGPLCN